MAITKEVEHLKNKVLDGPENCKVTLRQENFNCIEVTAERTSASTIGVLCKNGG